MIDDTKEKNNSVKTNPKDNTIKEKNVSTVQGSEAQSPKNTNEAPSQARKTPVDKVENNKDSNKETFVEKKSVTNQNQNISEEKGQPKKLIGKKPDSKNGINSNKPVSRKSSDQSEQDKSVDGGELVEKLVSINRVAKVVKGGRRFSFAALVVVGDGNGLVGHGKGKAKEVPEAIKKATDEAKNKMIRVPLRQGRTLHHDIQGRYDSGKVYLRSAPSGTGVIAGGPMRAVFEALGIQDIVAKSVGTSNPHNMVRATFEALRNASSPKIIAMRRGLKINEITKRRKSEKEGIDVKT